MDYDLGYTDLEEKTRQPLYNAFGSEVLPMWPIRSVTHVSGLDPRYYGAGDGNRTHVRSLGSFYTAIVRRPLGVSNCT